eukprot:4137000-Amphidinium_carterae.3
MSSDVENMPCLLGISRTSIRSWQRASPQLHSIKRLPLQRMILRLIPPFVLSLLHGAPFVDAVRVPEWARLDKVIWGVLRGRARYAATKGLADAFAWKAHQSGGGRLGHECCAKVNSVSFLRGWTACAWSCRFE